MSSAACIVVAVDCSWGREYQTGSSLRHDHLHPETVDLSYLPPSCPGFGWCGILKMTEAGKHKVEMSEKWESIIAKEACANKQRLDSPGVLCSNHSSAVSPGRKVPATSDV